MRTRLVKFIVVILGTGGVLATTQVASLASSVQIVSPYPSVSVSAGKTVTFNFKVLASPRQRVNLQITQAPSGWKTTIRGGGFVIKSVYGEPTETAAPDSQLDVAIPADAAKGQYTVTMKADGTSGGSNTLQFGIEIAEVAQGAVTLTSDFGTLKGAADAALTYSVKLTNNTPQSTTFDLSGSGPEGWDVTVQPSGQAQASSVKVDGGQQTNLDVKVTPATNATAGTYDVKVSAVGGGQTAELTLHAEITGNVKLSVTTPSQRLNTKATAGRATDFAIDVKNDGTSPVPNVSLTSSPPTGWKVTFSPSTVKTIGAKKSARVVAHITPSGDAVAGDYVLTLTAAGQGSTANADVRVTVETSKIWGAIGLLVIAAAVYVLLRVFRQYGRR